MADETKSGDAAQKTQGVSKVTTRGKQKFTRAQCLDLGLDPSVYGYKKATAAELSGADGDEA